MDDLTLKLTGYSRAEFEEAKSDQVLVLVLQIAATIFSALAIFVPNMIVTYSTAVVAILATLAWNYVSARGSRRKATAERARRAIMLIGGLGRQLSGKELSDILGAFTVSEAKAQKWIDPNYFDAEEATGPVRLARMMEQSAFWSKDLYKQSARQVWWQVTAFIIVSVVGLLFLPLFPEAKFLIQIAQTVCLGLTFFVTRDLLSKAASYGESANALEQLDEKLVGVIASNPTEADVLSIFGDYNSIVECTPLINSGLYRKHNPRLEALWAARRGKPVEQHGPAS